MDLADGRVRECENVSQSTSNEFTFFTQTRNIGQAFSYRVAYAAINKDQSTSHIACTKDITYESSAPDPPIQNGHSEPNEGDLSIPSHARWPWHLWNEIIKNGREIFATPDTPMQTTQMENFWTNT